MKTLAAVAAWLLVSGAASARAQETPVLILALLAEDACAQAEQAGPRQMIKRQTANQFFDDCVACAACSAANGQ